MKRLLRYLRFNLVGAMGTVVQLASLAALNRMLAGHYLLAAGGAVELAVVHNFVWHVNYTWAECGGGGMGRFLRFQMGNGVVSLVGNVALMRLLVQGFGAPVLVANGVAIVCCSVANFWVGEVWAFRGAGGAGLARAMRLGRILPLALFWLVLGRSSFAQTPPAANLPMEGRLGTDCAYANWFLGPAAATGGKLSLNTFTGGVTFGQYFARPFGRGVTASPQFELGVVGPIPHGTKVDGLGSMNAMFANRVRGRGLYPSFTVGYTRLFVNGNAVNFGVGVDFGKDEYKRLFRVELRDYYLFTGPRQHVLGLRFGIGRFISD
jgi:putative flippase GtrA